MHHLDQILIVLGCGCVLPIMVVWLMIRESMNKTNQRTQIVLAAIEKNPDMDIECMVQIPNIRYAAQEFRDDLVVYMIGMDENRKKWWSTIKEMDLRKKDLTQTDRPYEIQHSWAYDDKTGALLPGFKRLDIKTIPHNYLVDRSGRIIAKNISITLAIDKIKALLEKREATMKKAVLILFTFHLSLFTSSAQSLTDSLRTDALRWASRGYFNKSLDYLRQMPADSLSIEDMRLCYDNFAQLGQGDSLAYWADELLKHNPYDASLIADYAPRLNSGWQGEMGKKTFPKKVIDICKKYCERDSTHILINRQLAEAYYNIGNYDMALLELKKLEAVGDTCFGTLYTLGLTYQRMGDNSSAYDYLYRAYEKNDHHAYCLFMLGIVSNKVGLGAEALSYLGEAEHLLMPDRQTLFRLHKELAEALRLKGEPDFRLEELQACMQYAEEKDVNELTYMMAQCYFQLKQRDKAKEYYSKFLEATENKEYNDKIKQMRNQAQQSLRMMMW